MYKGKKFEYKSQKRYWDDNELEEVELNEEGQEGWEVCGLHTNRSSKSAVPEVIFILKREIL